MTLTSYPQCVVRMTSVRRPNLFVRLDIVFLFQMTNKYSLKLKIDLLSMLALFEPKYNHHHGTLMFLLSLSPPLVTCSRHSVSRDPPVSQDDTESGSVTVPRCEVSRQHRHRLQRRRGGPGDGGRVCGGGGGEGGGGAGLGAAVHPADCQEAGLQQMHTFLSYLFHYCKYRNLLYLLECPVL